MNKDEALKLAQEALETNNKAWKHLADSGDAGFWEAEEQPFYELSVKTITAIKEALAQPEPMRLRRGDILRCIETDELCTVWSTSTTGKTLIKWGANDFGGYTAEQIGELFWLEPSPDDLELAAEKSDNYAAFHAGYRFAVAHPLAQPEQEPVAWLCRRKTGGSFFVYTEEQLHELGYGNISVPPFDKVAPLYTTPPQRKPLTDEEIGAILEDTNAFGTRLYTFARAIEAAHGIKGEA